MLWNNLAQIKNILAPIFQVFHAQLSMNQLNFFGVKTSWNTTIKLMTYFGINWGKGKILHTFFC